MSQIRFVQLPKSKVVIDLENLAGIGMAELNKYMALPKIGANALVFDGSDNDALLAWMERAGIFAKVEPLPEPSKLATA